MVQKTFSTGWKSSTQPRKQRKYSYNAPLHTRQKKVHVHLSSDLRKKYGLRRVQVKKGDKVQIMRGQHKKKEGKVDRVNLKREKLYVTGIEFIKKDGTKIPVAFTPSNVMIIAVDTSDKKRKMKMERIQTTLSHSTKPVLTSADSETSKQHKKSQGETK
ncbi:50S ribosomal protein L24 [Candidatus Woesearchaeota archaeon CG10_big_fil_rev_8_21_14_0_10_36_11]|nr:MAG: 50S ribosomal protein L24 [Candidatus Woesearchaeota archaeon CG10_big_fil_rev_8_21_14_0_10_36_11]